MVLLYTLETPRLLVADKNSKENSKTPFPVEDLLQALTDLCQNSRFSLMLLSSSQASEATARTIKTNPANYPHLSRISELALQSHTITNSSPTGYSPQRWSF
ncbi:unnamed protein product [Clonostachys rosea]|uniref:Uncharacterized protein n=1 Tax=Bionectria ochroleuca TaxID=29856 RepID=A0ABY6TMW6_BIOOC|nr:unnamed protein product [Clonostachys rosea]